MDKTIDIIHQTFQVDASHSSPVILPHPRQELVKLFDTLAFRTGAEIGVSYGHFSQTICEANPSLQKLYCIDSWTTTKGYTEIGKGEHTMQRRYQLAKEALSSYPCELIRKTSMEAVQDFEPNSLDFVYIDANHVFDYVMQDIIEWSKIVRPGGIVAGHDYRCANHHEISRDVSTAVLTYAKVHEIPQVFIFDQERSSSWMFVKM